MKADGTALAEGLIVSAMHRMESITLEETDKSSNAEASSRNDSEELVPDELCPAESTKRKLSEQRNPCLDDFSSSSKKRKKLSACGDKPALDGSSAKGRDMEDVVPLRNKVVIISEHSICESTESSQKNNIQDETKDVTEVTEMMPSYPVGGPVEDSLQSDEWKSIEKELYLKGVEIFGRNRYTCNMSHFCPFVASLYVLMIKLALKSMMMLMKMMICADLYNRDLLIMTMSVRIRGTTALLYYVKKIPL